MEEERKFVNCNNHNVPVKGAKNSSVFICTTVDGQDDLTCNL